jgi:hypothetical protein
LILLGVKKTTSKEYKANYVVVQQLKPDSLRTRRWTAGVISGVGPCRRARVYGRFCYNCFKRLYFAFLWLLLGFARSASSYTTAWTYNIRAGQFILNINMYSTSTLVTRTRNLDFGTSCENDTLLKTYVMYNVLKIYFTLHVLCIYGELALIFAYFQ